MGVQEDKAALFQAVDKIGDAIGQISFVGDGDLAEARSYISMVYGSDESPDISEAVEAIGHAVALIQDAVGSLVTAKEKVNEVAERYGQ